jgi:hypothetical protein
MGWWRVWVSAGYFINFSCGLIGLFSNPPPQLGHTLCKTVCTHSAQKVHSKEQIMASLLSFGRFLPQFSQIGLNVNMIKIFLIGLRLFPNHLQIYGVFASYNRNDNILTLLW